MKQATIIQVITIATITFILSAIVSYFINKSQTNEIVTRLKK